MMQAAESRADEAQRALVEEQLRKVAAAPVTISDAKSMHPGTLHLQGKGWKLGIPFTVLVAAAPFLWTVVQHVIGLEQQVKDLNKAVAGFQASNDAKDTAISDLQDTTSNLRLTQARMAGYLAKTLPMAGVSVPGAELGAISMDVDRDPEPLGAKHRPHVVTHTRIPAPAPAP